MKQFYNSETEQLMQLHFSRLSEKEKRQYAGIESQKLGFGGKMYISKLFTISRNTLNRGLLELTQSTPIGWSLRQPITLMETLVNNLG